MVITFQMCHHNIWRRWRCCEVTCEVTVKSLSCLTLYKVLLKNEPSCQFQIQFSRDGLGLSSCSDPIGTISHTDALKEVTEMTSQLQHSLIRLENFQKLTELQHDLIGIDNLTAPGRVSNTAELSKPWLFLWPWCCIATRCSTRSLCRICGMSAEALVHNCLHSRSRSAPGDVVGKRITNASASTPATVSCFQWGRNWFHLGAGLCVWVGSRMLYSTKAHCQLCVCLMWPCGHSDGERCSAGQKCY